MPAYIYTCIHTHTNGIYNHSIITTIGVVQSSVVIGVSVTLGGAAIVLLVIVLSSVVYWKIKHTCKYKLMLSVI